MWSTGGVREEGECDLVGALVEVSLSLSLEELSMDFWFDTFHGG